MQSPLATSELEPVAATRPALASDTLADSVLILVALTVLQRLIGFLRGLLFCRWLSPEELGEWEMCFNFLMLAAPIAILSLPGAFGRYLEYFRVRGQFRTFVERTGLATAVLASMTIALLIWQREAFSELIFGRPDRTQLVGWLALALLAVIAMNFTTDLFTALRMQRISSRLQTIHTFAFAAIGIALLAGAPHGAESVVYAYGGAALVAFAVGLPRIWHAWWHAPAQNERLPHAALWGKLVPYAVSLWLTNWLSNLFAMVDRYMIIHYSGRTPDDALDMVGQYHAARLAPVLLLLFAGLLGSILLPHLSHDWEAGRRHEVSRRLNMFLKVFGLSLLGIGAAVLVFAPLLFDLVLQGKYPLGLAVLPGTLAYCIWAGIGFVARTYLWCDEKVALSSLAYLLGLVTCILLNLVLLPQFGLHGAVWATTAGNLAALGMILLLGRARGFELEAGTLLVMLLPVALLFGRWPALVVALAALALALFTQVVLSRVEKRQLADLAHHYFKRLRKTPEGSLA